MVMSKFTLLKLTPLEIWNNKLAKCAFVVQISDL